MIKKDTKTLGQQGEHLALQHLTSRGYIIVKTNWRCQQGEIDIVAQDDAVLVFVEVRTRRAMNTETAFASITPLKQSRLSTLAYVYLSEHHLENHLWRVDLIAIAIPRSGQPIIEHAEDGLAW